MEDGLYPIAPQRPPGDRDYAKHVDAVLKLVNEGGRWNALRAGHLIEGLLIDLAEARSAAPQRPAWLAQARASIAQDATAPVDYAQLAERLDMSERSLRRNFRKRLGISPHQYRIELRVRAARDLLVQSDLPLKEIARQLGYADVFYFGRQFKAQVGVSPAQFRRSREG
jgi:transcriptional regulator GlxA family with amidase domain